MAAVENGGSVVLSRSFGISLYARQSKIVRLKSDLVRR